MLLAGVPCYWQPAGWDDIPRQIPDPAAEKPEDWNEEEDGEWEPPMIDNPDYKVCAHVTLLRVPAARAGVFQLSFNGRQALVADVSCVCPPRCVVRVSGSRR